MGGACPKTLAACLLWRWLSISPPLQMRLGASWTTSDDLPRMLSWPLLQASRVRLLPSPSAHLKQCPHVLTFLLPPEPPQLAVTLTERFLILLLAGGFDKPFQPSDTQRQRGFRRLCRTPPWFQCVCKTAGFYFTSG